MMKKLFTLVLVLFTLPVAAQYVQQQHKPVPNGVIPVNGPGSYDKPGATYMLTCDIFSSRTAVFLGKDVTLDLNGYTITYAAGDYQHAQNYGFEDGLNGWDVSNAPGAKIESTRMHAFIGEKLLSLKAGDEIVSSYVSLPVAGRSYHAICGVTGTYYNDMGGDLSKDMRISIFVEDERGNNVTCTTEYGDSTLVSCPVINKSTRLGGGFIIAHLNNLPAGKYRVRVRAENDCLLDEIDIRPSYDAGVAIVESTHPYGHYHHLYNRNHAAFFDYTADPSTGSSVDGIPVVKGTGSVTIRNGVIRSGTVAVLSFGIQSTARDVRVILENVKVETSGINTIAVDVPQATIIKCTFDVKSPFIINRHGSEFYGVDLTGENDSEVSFCEFYGGQGCLSFHGKNSRIHHNRFVNRQTVTNHYSIMAMGDGSHVFMNVFEPEIGSGLEIFRHKNISIFSNEFRISAAPPSCEYADHLSTNAIRIADYGSPLGDPEGCYGNRIYNNKFYLKGKKYSEYPNFIPMVSAVFFSTSAGDNEMFGNEIYIDQADPGTDAEAFAFYIGNCFGGKLYNNRIVTNVTPIWTGSSYGKAEKTVISGNTIIKAEGSGDFLPVRMGSYEHESFVAKDIEFRSNDIQGVKFGIDKTDQHHSYSVYWTLTVRVVDRSGKPLAGREVIIAAKDGEIVLGTTSENGIFTAELPEYSVDGNEMTSFSPYTVSTGKKKLAVTLDKNISAEIITK